MSKGIHSTNSLKALAHPIERFLAAWGTRERPGRGTGTALPAPYELAALRGEGILRSRFFNNLVEKIPVELEAAEQIELWNTLVEDGGHITAWVQRLGVAKAIRKETMTPLAIAGESRKLYCVLLDALSKQAPDLLPWAVDAYFWHVWKGRFPTQPTVSKKTAQTSTDQMRERLVRVLRKHHSESVEVKESFEQTEEVVRFAILAKRPSVGKWEELVCVDRPRLKTARLAAYGAAMVMDVAGETV